MRNHQQAAAASLFLLGLGVTAQAFTFLGYPSQASIDAGRLKRWEDWSLRRPFSLSYAIEEDFFGDSDDQLQAKQAVRSVLDTWSSASMGLSFELADWSAVPNDDDIFHVNYEGPGIDDYVPGETPLPGWGANIDFFSRPSGFEIISEGKSYTMGEQNLGFAVINQDTRQINSVDVYLNSDSPLIDWTFEGSGEGFDVETVLLHEVGHGLGFDHPDLAGDNDSPNLNPHNFRDNWHASSKDVMYSTYTGVKRDLTKDEEGGLWYLYPVINAETGDLNGDRVVNLSDLGTLLSFFERNVPVADIDFDGYVGVGDLGILLASYLTSEDSTDPNDGPLSVPLPTSGLLLLLGAPAVTRRRR
jgi:Matrixin